MAKKMKFNCITTDIQFHEKCHGIKILVFKAGTRTFEHKFLKLLYMSTIVVHSKGKPYLQSGQIH